MTHSAVCHLVMFGIRRHVSCTRTHYVLREPTLHERDAFTLGDVPYPESAKTRMQHCIYVCLIDHYDHTDAHIKRSEHLCICNAACLPAQTVRVRASAASASRATLGCCHQSSHLLDPLEQLRDLPRVSSYSALQAVGDHPRDVLWEAAARHVH